MNVPNTGARFSVIRELSVLVQNNSASPGLFIADETGDL